MSLQAVIFDVDGTLADTEEAHREAFNASFHQFGLPWEWDAALYRDLLSVTGGKERMRHYCERFFPDFLADPQAGSTIAALHREKTRHYAELVAAGAVAARPGVVRLIGQLHAAGIRLAIATTTSRSNVDALLAASLKTLPPDIFEVIGAAEQADDKKPSPAIYRWVLERLALSPDECLAIEDSKNGVRAAQAAGIPTLVTECVWTAGEDFTGALAVLSDLGEPDRPCRAVQTHRSGCGYVDAGVLRSWYDEWQTGRPHA
ncbi:MAG: HAD-IA family hydrolase [Rhodocyclaceae bacterium]|nr:HAD-IA family hydrolase [Rhodocyclaceae bacterium]